MISLFDALDHRISLNKIIKFKVNLREDDLQLWEIYRISSVRADLGEKCDSVKCSELLWVSKHLWHTCEDRVSCEMFDFLFWQTLKCSFVLKFSLKTEFFSCVCVCYFSVCLENENFFKGRWGVYVLLSYCFMLQFYFYYFVLLSVCSFLFVSTF